MLSCCIPGAARELVRTSRVAAALTLDLGAARRCMRGTCTGTDTCPLAPAARSLPDSTTLRVSGTVRNSGTCHTTQHL
eukprot:3775582-Rhodomonas_salina.4